MVDDDAERGGEEEGQVFSPVGEFDWTHPQFRSHDEEEAEEDNEEDDEEEVG